MTAAPSRGSTLIEVLVALALSSVFAVLIYGFARSCLRAVQTQQARSDARETAFLALDLMIREIRQAGYGSPDPVLPRLAVAEHESLSLRADFNGDGQLDGANESVRYAADDERGTLTRASGSAPPQPVVTHLEAASLSFSYFDAVGVELNTGISGLDAVQRAAVCRVDVAFTIAVPSRDPFIEESTRVTVASTVALRNVQ